ncbi:MAG: hypothetical protein KF724_06025 [Phycisphaeraceae bacterium]|nr:hypothetical protein [Phycisphaeraceae bacterium]
MNSTCKALVALTLPIAFVAGCEQPPKRIDPTGREAVTSMGIDYSDAQEIAASMTNKMLSSAAFRRYSPPVLARYNNTVNKTADPNLPLDSVNTRIRSTLLNSGQIQFTAALVTAEGFDPSVREARDLANDPMFNQNTVQQSGALGAVDAPQISVNSEFLSVYSTDGRARQRTYELRIFVTDLLTGRVIWEDTSKAIAKLGRN